MTRYLAYTSPARGHLYPIVPTLRELRERGHEVHVRTLASEVTALQAEGLQAQPIAAEIEQTPLDDWQASTPQEGLSRALATFATRAAHELSDLQRAIAQVDPDVLLVDITTIGASAVAEAAGLPWATSIPLFQHFAFGPESATELTFVPFAIDPAGIEVLNAPRRKLGLAPLGGASEVWRAPLHLYYTAEPFQPEGMHLPDSFRLVGPGIWEPAVPVPTWLQGIASPLVLVTASSEMQGDDVLIQTALAAFADNGINLAITTAAHEPSRFSVGPNVHVERWLPHQPIIDKSTCVVCHGGMGITQKALAAGVPVCIVPFGRDQFEVAKRVAEADAGTVVLPDALNPASLRAGVFDSMNKRAGAERLGASFARAGGAQAAADALQSIRSSEPLGSHRVPA